jgi:hypothetical protein
MDAVVIVDPMEYQRDAVLRVVTMPLTCGAPLRNRTVDLLLTMETLCRLS